MSDRTPRAKRIHVVDSHTEGEPTRVVCEGGPDLGGGSLADRRARFASDHDRYRSAIVNEPRGSDIMVGALLCEPVDRTCATGVIFFNDVGYLGMCGHGIMGLVVTLAWLGRISTGEHRIETPVGVVSAKLHANGRVSVANVSSYRYAHAVSVDVPGLGRMTGDVAWGGNWFFLASDHAQELSQGNVTTLMDVSRRIREALRTSGVRGEGGADIDHIELLGPPSISGAHSKNFVLCPGAAFDRSPCGTGTSAKLACLYVDGALAPGDVWQQESITGTLFEGRFVIDEKRPGWILPSITGTAHVTAEATLILADADPLQWGIRKPWEKTS